MAKRKRAKKPRQPSTLERGFMTIWGSVIPNTVPAPEREHAFSADVEPEWRFDFAWPALKLAVELQGGTWIRGRHNRGGGFRGDCEKMNAAQLAGWTVLQYTTDHMEKMPVQVVEEVAKEVTARCGEEFGT